MTVSTACKELFSVTDRLMFKAKCTQIPSSVPIAWLPQRFSDFFCQKINTTQQNIDSSSCTAPSSFIGQFFVVVFFWKSAHPSHFSAVRETAVPGLLRKVASKTCDLDPIPISLLIDCSDEIVPALSFC